jgi:hypothetical protein
VVSNILPNFTCLLPAWSDETSWSPPRLISGALIMRCGFLQTFPPRRLGAAITKRGNMRKVALVAAAVVTLTASALISTEASAGCYRVGETGYHWYNFCFGPHFMYPHHRVCRNGYCWFR